VAPPDEYVGNFDYLLQHGTHVVTADATRHVADYVRISCCHPQNRKYITYCTVVSGGQTNGHRYMYRKSDDVYTCGYAG